MRDVKLHPLIAIKEEQERPTRAFLNSFNYFRGVGIILIVAGHCFGIARWDPNSFGEDVFFSMIKGGTALFVFISGFLFHHVFYSKFNYKKFLTSKFKNVFIPYLFMSFVPIIFTVIGKGTGTESDSYFFTQDKGIWAEYIRPALLYLWTGDAVLAYWYIPFAMVMFALSPIFMAYINSSLTVRNVILFTTLLIPVIIHRPIDDLSVVQSVFYFSPIYLLGIQSSMHREFIYEKFKGREIYIGFSIIALAAIQATFSGTVGNNFRKAPFDITEPDIMVVQKCLICIFFMVFLHRFESANLSILDKIASASFAIFFLHPVVISLFALGPKYWTGPLAGFPSWLVFTTGVVFFCYCIAVFIKKTIPNLSRRLIGW